MHCDVCNNDIESPIEFTGNAKERDQTFKHSGWKKVGDDHHIGPKCRAVYDKVEQLQMDVSSGVTIETIDHSDDRPTIDIIGDDSVVMAYKSRYCFLGFKSRSGAQSHERKFHMDVYVKGKYGTMYPQRQIPKVDMAARGGHMSLLPRCKREVRDIS